jgi:hypothetical protein
LGLAFKNLQEVKHVGPLYEPLSCPALCTQPSNIILSLEGGQAVLKVRYLIRTSLCLLCLHLSHYPTPFFLHHSLSNPICGDVQVADFSSAVDPEGVRNGLYGIFGPTQHEETLEYAPPEVRYPPTMARTYLGQLGSYIGR